MAGASRSRGEEGECRCQREGLGAGDGPGLPHPSLGAQTCPTTICIFLSVNMVVFNPVLPSWYRAIFAQIYGAFPDTID